MAEIVKQVGLTSLVRTKGINYIVGENGENLSGGQRQRIEIARAVLFKTELLLIDEATSALDSVNAAKIRELFKNIPQATIEVAHHINENELPFYDRIVIVVDGKLVESGSYDELKLNDQSYIHRIYQLGGNLRTNNT